jgi:hypothetical protein
MNDNAVNALYVLATEGGDMTTTEIAKHIFDPDGTEEVRNADRKVRHYLDDTYEHLTVVSEEGGAKRFSVREDRVWFGVGKVDVVAMGEQEVTIGLGRVMVYMDEEGEPQVINMEVQGEDEVEAVDGEDL